MGIEPVLEWEGQSYPVPILEPLQNRDAASLHPLFRDALERYIAFARGFTPYEIRIGECRRSLERQAFLLAQGRINGERVRSWTIDSRHRYGLAADLILVDPATRSAVWTSDVWLDLYRDAPPSWFALTTISKELVHLEWAAADALIARAEQFGLVQT